MNAGVHRRPNAIRVASIEEQDLRLGRCPCGGEWKVRGEVVTPSRGTWIDELVIQCKPCGSIRDELFDIGSFLVARPGIRSGTCAARALVKPAHIGMAA